MTLVYVALAWVMGILFMLRFEPTNGTILLLILLAAFGLFNFRKEASGRLLMVCIMAFGLGALRFDSANPETTPDHVIHLNDQGRSPTTLTGVVVAEPERVDTGLRLLIEVETAAGEARSGQILARVDRVSEVAYGDRVRLYGFLRTPPPFDDFSYRDYLARSGVFSVMYNASVEVLERDQANPLMRRLLNAKAEARAHIIKALPEPQAGLLVGILLGDETGLSDQTREVFARTGASHIIAISGFNMVILAQFIMVILRALMPSRKVLAAVIGITAILIYTVFVGAGAAVLRAALMSGLLILGQSLNRRTFVPASLGFAVLLMSALDPWVLWDIGFQLSFAAVMGMALFVDPLTRGLRNLLTRFSDQDRVQSWLKLLTEPLIVTLSAQITTTPLILVYFGRLSVVSLAVNFLIIPVQPLVLAFGAVGVIVSFIVPSVGALILQGAWLFLTWSVNVIETFAAIPWADVELRLPSIVVTLFFVALGLGMAYQATRPRWVVRWLGGSMAVKGLQIGGLIVFALLLNVIGSRPDGQLKVIFPDVGGANAVLIQTPKGGTILIDGGAFPTRLLDELGDSLPYRKRRIDVLILTAPNEDNLLALTEVIERYQIGVVITNGQPSLDETYGAILRHLDAAGVSLQTVSAGYEIETDDGLTISVLYPFSPPEANIPPSEAGLVLRLTYGEAVFLLMGAANAEVEYFLLDQPHLLQATVLQVGNHGGSNASSAPFIHVVNPQAAIIQLDPSRQGDPSPVVVERLSGAALFRGDQNGRVQVSSDGQTLWIQSR